ncbi:hypothetical protein Bca4012_082456 [Brassica carinata]
MWLIPFQGGVSAPLKESDTDENNFIEFADENAVEKEAPPPPPPRFQVHSFCKTLIFQTKVTRSRVNLPIKSWLQRFFLPMSDVPYIFP